MTAPVEVRVDKRFRHPRERVGRLRDRTVAGWTMILDSLAVVIGD